MDSGLQDMHEAGRAVEKNSGGSAVYEPTDEEKKILKYVLDSFDKAKKFREPYVEKWKDYYQYFRGKQWKNKRPEYRHSDVINLIFPAIQNQVPLITDARPSIDFIAEKPEDLDFAKILNDLILSDWDRLNWSHVILESLYDSHIYGTGVGMLDFDDEADYNIGSARWMSLEPMYCYPNPGATDINQGRKCEIFQYAEPMSVEKVKQLYPKMAQYIKPDIRDLWQEEKTDINNNQYRSSLDNKTFLDGNATVNQVNTDSVLLITTYCRPLETEEYEVASEEEDGDPTYEVKLKYPRGRKIVSTRSLVLETEELPYEDKSFPIQKFVNYVDPRSFWGISDIEQAEGPQMLFNKMVSFTMDVLTLTGNPIWIIDTSSGVDPDNLFNIPGGIVEKEPGSEVRRESGTQLQPYVIQMIDRMKNWFDEVVGTTEVSRGVAPGGVTAARAIESLQQLGQTRVRLKTRILDESFLREMGRQYVQLVLKNYTVPRVRRVTDVNGVEKYFKFHVEHNQIGEETKFVVNYQKYEEREGQLIPGPNLDRAIAGSFDVRVNTVSALPFARAEAEAKAFRLAEAGIIDAEELLKAIEWPNVEAVVQRLNERRREAEQQGAQ